MTTHRTPTRSLAQLVGVLNRFANRLLIPLLESSLGETLGRRLAVLDYVGRRSGLPHRLVVRYVAEGRSVRITVGMAEHKTWWRNFETPHPLTLRLAGIDHDVFAHLVQEGDRTLVIADLEFTDHPEVLVADLAAAPGAPAQG